MSHFLPKMNPNNGVEDIENVGNSQYLSTIIVGGQKLKVVGDTGSFSLLLTSTRCAEKECPRRTFNPKGSSSYVELQREDYVHYGSGEVWTHEAKDAVSLAGKKERLQHFWEITRVGDKMENMWKNVKFDGIMGFGWRGIAQSTQEKTILETFEVKFFTFCFGTINLDIGDMRETPSRIYWDEAGAKTLGDQKFKTIQVMPGTVHHWAVKISNVGLQQEVLEDKPFHISCGEGQPCAAILDTGTSSISPPIRQLGAIFNRIGPIEEDCSNYEYLPTLHFWLGGDEKDGGFHVELPPTAYIKRISFKTLNARIRKFRKRIKKGLKKRRESRNYPDSSLGQFGSNVSSGHWQKEEPDPQKTKKQHEEEDEAEEEEEKDKEKDKRPEYYCTHRFLFSLMESQHGPVWIIGAPFFQKYLTRFDRSSDPPSVGLVKHPGVCPGTKESKFESDKNASFFLHNAGDGKADRIHWNVEDELDIPGIGMAMGKGAKPMNITL